MITVLIARQTGRVGAGPTQGEAGEVSMSAGQEAARTGIGLGAALAISISWSANQSILWAIVHGVFSWFYVGYYALVVR